MVGFNYYIYVIYKPWQGVYNKYTTQVRGQRKLAIGRGVYQWQASDDRGQGSYICCIYRNGRGSYDIY